MKEETIKELEGLIMECGGNYGFYHSKRLINLVNLISEGKPYNEDIILFCAYTHDLGAFKKYAIEGVDHAARSREVVETFLNKYNFGKEDEKIILETIENHHKKDVGNSFEALLLRDADALDFLGTIGMSRDFCRSPFDLKKAIQSIKRHRRDLVNLLELESSKKMSKERIAEMDHFIENFEKESMNLY